MVTVEPAIGKHLGHDNPLDDVGTGQPLWYWALDRPGKVAELKRRASVSGTTYSHDASTTGLLEDGTPDPNARQPSRKGLGLTPEQEERTRHQRAAARERRELAKARKAATGGNGD